MSVCARFRNEDVVALLILLDGYKGLHGYGARWHGCIAWNCSHLLLDGVADTNGMKVHELWQRDILGNN